MFCPKMTSYKFFIISETTKHAKGAVNGAVIFKVRVMFEVTLMCLKIYNKVSVYQICIFKMKQI